MTKKAILLAANPLMEDVFGNIFAHAMHLARHGGVFWEMGSTASHPSVKFQHKDVNCGYFYNTVSGMIDHWFKATFIRAFPEIEDPELYHVFVPEWRQEYFNSS